MPNVYLAHDATGQLLYVGISLSVSKRFRQHRAGRPRTTSLHDSRSQGGHHALAGRAGTASKPAPEDHDGR
jgi:hypothetical protein